MKKMMLSSVMLVLSFVSSAQTFEVEFDQFTGFNTGQLGKYEEVIDPENYLVTRESLGGTNKYVINLTEMTMDRYFDGDLRESKPILTNEKVGVLLFMTIEDEELLTGNKIISTVVLNTDMNNTAYPKFVLYFLSTKTKTYNGFVAQN